MKKRRLLFVPIEVLDRYQTWSITKAPFLKIIKKEWGFITYYRENITS